MRGGLAADIMGLCPGWEDRQGVGSGRSSGWQGLQLIRGRYWGQKMHYIGMESTGGFMLYKHLIHFTQKKHGKFVKYADCIRCLYMIS